MARTRPAQLQTIIFDLNDDSRRRSGIRSQVADDIEGIKTKIAEIFDRRKGTQQFQILKDDIALIAQDISAADWAEGRIEVLFGAEPDFSIRPDVERVETIIAQDRGIKRRDELPPGLNDASLAGENITTKKLTADLFRKEIVRGHGKPEFVRRNLLKSIETIVGDRARLDSELGEELRI